MTRVVIVGRGRLGRALATNLRRAAVYEVQLSQGRRLEARAKSSFRGTDVVVIAVPDPFLDEVAAALSHALPTTTVVLHCSGSRGPQALVALSARGHAVGVMHPMVSFSHPRKAPPLRGTTFVIDGTQAARRTAGEIARAIGARPLRLPVHGARYHAAAALCANGAAALTLVAVEILEAEGFTRRQAERCLGALLSSVGHNVEAVGVPTALSGPVVRGDTQTVEAHRQSLASLPGALAAYDAIGPTIVRCARAAGLSASKARQMQRVLKKRVT